MAFSKGQPCLEDGGASQDLARGHLRAHVLNSKAASQVTLHPPQAPHDQLLCWGAGNLAAPDSLGCFVNCSSLSIASREADGAHVEGKAANDF